MRRFCNFLSRDFFSQVTSRKLNQRTILNDPRLEFQGATFVAIKISSDVPCVGTLWKNCQTANTMSHSLWLILPLSNHSTFFVVQNLVIFAISKFSAVPFFMNCFHFRNASKYYVKEVLTMEFDSNICNRRFWADIFDSDLVCPSWESPLLWLKI